MKPFKKTKKSLLVSARTFLLMGVALLILVGFYIFQINSLTAGAYGATVAEKELQQHRETTANLQATMAQNRTVWSLGELASQFNFEKVDKVQYIRVLAGSVAER